MARFRLTTTRQRQQIADIIRDHHLAFTAETLGPQAISKADYERLLKAGLINIRKAVLPVADAATAAHILGTLATTGDPTAILTMNPGNFWTRVLTPAHLASLSLAEREAIEVAQDSVANYIKGLGNKIDKHTGQLLVEADNKLRKHMQTRIKQVVTHGVAERQTVKAIANQLRTVTRDAKTDWLKIASTEVHNVMEEGRANAILKGHPDGSDPLVFKRPRPDACPYCTMLYLKSDKRTPRIFTLSALAANGTNVLRKARRPLLHGPLATEWKPVIGAMHPWCRCTLHELPDGFGFDTAGKMVYLGTATKALVEDPEEELLHHQCADE